MGRSGLVDETCLGDNTPICLRAFLDESHIFVEELLYKRRFQERERDRFLVFSVSVRCHRVLLTSQSHFESLQGYIIPEDRSRLSMAFRVSYQRRG